MNIRKEDQGIIYIVSIFMIGLFLGSYYSYKIFNSVYFKFLLFLFIVWVMSIDILLSGIIGIIILVIYQLILKASINEGFIPYDNEYDEYLKKPLLKNEELEQLGDNIDFTLITPKMNSELLVKEGKKLLDISNELDNDLKIRYDSREKEIMDDTIIMGSRMIKSGINGLESSINGEYYGDFLKESIANPNIIYNDNENNKYNKNYSNIILNNDIIKDEFVKLSQNKTISRIDFDKQYEKIKKMQDNLI